MGIKFIGQGNPMMIDIWAFTSLEQYVLLKGTAFDNGYNLIETPYIDEYVKLNRNYELFSEHIISEEAFGKEIEKQAELPEGEIYKL